MCLYHDATLGRLASLPEIPVTRVVAFDVWQLTTERAMWGYAGTKCGSIRERWSLVGLLCSYAGRCGGFARVCIGLWVNWNPPPR